MILVESSRLNFFVCSRFLFVVGGAMGYGQIGIPEAIVVIYILVMALVVIWPAARICRRIGFSPVLGILAVIPLANVVLLWYVALAQWPKAETGPQSI
jgi:hypothetical protein